MKKILYIILAIVVFSCNSEDAPDCFQNSGDTIQEEFIVNDFTKITAFARVELIVKQEATQKVVVETGEYLLNDIEVKVENNTLLITNNNACNFSRDYGITKVYVSAPNLIEIRNGSGLTVSSDGILSYDNLKLVSEDFNSEGDVNSDGDFNVKVDCIKLDCIVNNLSTIFVSGEVDDLFVRYYSGDSRFEGRNLIAQNIDIFQRSSNDLIINPQLMLTGEIRSTGDVIVVNTPPTIDVEQFYTGKLIFE
ncbi:head GIN domain-containing protein [Psychroserpens jangbogonensis]|uniref:head GIN domain-containing protein n=1 Tax=Psychroserpens jangbogonensis TaxID=1484460 RepID=UPI00053EC85C|nr:head GIN domain-containing protein [Psychroserpens jangbogonensis]